MNVSTSDLISFLLYRSPGDGGINEYHVYARIKLLMGHDGVVLFCFVFVCFVLVCLQLVKA